MKKTLQHINDRIHKPENRERYNQLMLNPSMVNAGQFFINTYNQANQLAASADPNDKDYNIAIGTFNALIKRLNQWLNDNNWA